MKQLDSKRLGNQIVLFAAPPVPRPENMVLRRFAAQHGLAPDQIAVIDLAAVSLADLRGRAGLVEWMVRRGGVLLFANVDRAHPEVLRALRHLDSQGEWPIPVGASSVQVLWAHPSFHPVFSGSPRTGPFRNYLPGTAFGA